MKAITYNAYGPPEVLQFEDLPKPAPQSNEILIRTHATTVTSGDWRARSLDLPPGFGVIARLMFGVSGPRQRLLGSELAGIVEAAGKDVTKFQVGDRVFLFTGSALGCSAEYKCVSEDANVVPIPEGLAFHEAAPLSFGGTTVLDFFRKGGLREGDKVLINGASGGVGTAAIQIAKARGAIVTGVCSAANVELVESLGADRVVDYTNQDLTEIGEKFDIVMDTVGTAPFSKSKHLLNEKGRLLLVLGGLSDLLRIPWVAMTSSQRIVGGAAAELREDLCLLADLVNAGQFKPVIDRIYPVDQIVEAHRYVDSGRKRGNVVVSWVNSD